jgi:SPX domain protein involved in polyphosphate accumulation
VPSAEIIERREYKYLIDEVTAARLREAIRPFCELDPHAASQPGGRYTIDSCYFDTPSFALYRANVISLPERYKVRVRAYPPHADGPVFFEVKSRFNDVIKKTRAPVPRALWSLLVSDSSCVLPESMSGVRRHAVEKLVALVHGNNLRPVTMVRYEREPYVSTVDTYARVTFDRKIRSQALSAPTFDLGERGWRYNDNADMQRWSDTMTVLELKFTSAVPRWMSNLVLSFDLHRLSFSKYGTSIKTWYQSPVSRTPSRLIYGSAS